VPTNTLGSLIAVLAAAIWGSGDFLGGLATRKRSQYQVVALASFSGLIILLIAMLARGESLPSPQNALWSAAAALSGTIGIAALYRGLATSQAALVAPASSVIGVALPVLVGTLLYGPPGTLKWLGMAAGVLGIWLVSTNTGLSRGESRQALWLAFIAGLGFGGFFVLIAQVEAGAVFAPLVIAKCASLIFSLGMLTARRLRLPSLPGSGTALTAGVFDAGGNVFYLLAAQMTRLEFAALLASMAPAMTVLLAALVSRQRVNNWQKGGVALCLAAIALIVL